MRIRVVSFPQGTVHKLDDGRTLRRYGPHPSVAAYMDARAAQAEARSGRSTFDPVDLRASLVNSRHPRAGRS